MPRSGERRAIDRFVHNYNSAHSPAIIDLYARDDQEYPDAVLRLADDRLVGLEHTSYGIPKGAGIRNPSQVYHKIPSLRKVIERKFLCDFRVNELEARSWYRTRIGSGSEVWLLVQLRPTYTLDGIQEAVDGLQIPINFDRIFVQGPLAIDEGLARLGVLELTNGNLWYPPQKPVSAA